MKAAGKKTATKKTTKKRGKSKFPKVPVAIAAIVIAAAVCALVLGSVYVKGVETVYPKLTVNGIDVGGMTKQQATDAVAAELDGEESDPAVLQSVGVTVKTSTGQSLTLSGSDLDVDSSNYASLKANTMANAAYSYGRDASPLKNALTYLKCSVKPVDLAVDPDLSSLIRFNSDSVYSKVYDFAEDCSAASAGETYEVKAKEIVIHKSDVCYVADADAMYRQVMDALDQSLSQGSPVEITYEMQPGQTKSVDLKSIYDSVFVEPVDAYYKDNVLMPEVVGVSFDLEKAKTQYQPAENGSTITIPLIFTQPEILSKDLGDDPFADVLVEKSTSLSGSSSNRITNITLAASYVNGTILAPGGPCACNPTVGRRPRERGFKQPGANTGG
jgi:hypothetical protein